MIYRFLIIFSILLASGCAKEYSCEDCIPPEPPVVSTIKITDVTINAATFHGELIKTGKLLITDYGFCWALHSIPTVNDIKISLGQTDSLQSFVATQTGLAENQSYYVRAFAINNLGTVYGEELSFKTSHNTLNDCLVAYYPFNGNTNDESGNNNNGVANGGVLTADKNGNANKAFQFNGSNFIKVTNSPSLSGISTTFSISAWIYNAQPEVYVVCKSAYNGPDMQFRLYADPGGVHFANFNKAADFNNTLNPVNSWKHIVITSDGNLAKCYVNGVLVNTTSFHNDPSVGNNSTEMYLGADPHNATEFFTGKLDEIRIYCRVLSDAEVLQLYNL